VTISRLGISCLPGRGHLYPAVALGRRLVSRGYRVTVFSRAIGHSIVRDAGLDFCPIEDEEGFPKLAKTALRAANGPNTLNVMSYHCASVFRQLGAALSEAHIEGMLVDQADLASGTVAEQLGIPFITISILPPVYIDDDVPPFICDWQPTRVLGERDRNRRGNTLLSRLVAPILNMVNEQRRRRAMPGFLGVNDVFSSRAIVAQLPEFLDFPRAHPPRHLFHTGPFEDGQSRRVIAFPWELLTGEPLVYACMGTVRNDVRRTFEIIAAACAEFDIQLVMSLGGMRLTPEQFGTLPGNPIVVHYAPQRDILRKASVAIIHAGINTTLECIGHGVPMVAIPITDDQPGVAARIQWQGLGLALPFRKLTVGRLQDCTQKVLTDPRYRSAISKAQARMGLIRGLDQAVDIIETAFDCQP
jgi:zeaxanthin glucosyltransferase